MKYGHRKMCGINVAHLKREQLTSLAGNLQKWMSSINVRINEAKHLSILLILQSATSLLGRASDSVTEVWPRIAHEAIYAA